MTVLIPALTIVKTADTTSAVLGQHIGYTITVTNTGQTPYTATADTAVTDSFAEMADDAAYDGNATATIGTLVLRQPRAGLDREPVTGRRRHHSPTR